MGETQRLHLFGRPWLRRADGIRIDLGPQRRSQLLAVLGLKQDWLGRNELAVLLWPKRPPGAARSNLRKVLHELRLTQVEGLEEGAAGLRWLVPSDVQAFHEACRRGDLADVVALGLPSLMEDLDDAYSSEAFSAWVRAERTALRQQWRSFVLRALREGTVPDPLGLAEALLRTDLADAASVEVAVRLAHARGREDLLERWWRRHVEHLEELGVRPAADLSALSQRLAPRPALAPLYPLVGRRREQEVLIRHLETGRLVTLLGPGGVGKTRLARHVADALSDQYGDGALFVPVGDLEVPAALPTRVAECLSLNLDPRLEPTAQLTAHLQHRALLLVLDGFEPLIDAARDLTRWLSAAPGLRLLVTSRERLDIDGEWVLALEGLTPPSAAEARADAVHNDALRLFSLRATAHNPSFDLARAVEPVADICRRVGGLPLAIELAAAWVRLMPARDIAQELAASLALIADGPGGLSGVFERSWQLLTGREQEAFARLAVFRGGFTRKAALQVVDVDLMLVAALVDKSMVHVAADGRLDLHPLLQERAHHLLGAHLELERQHARWYLEQAGCREGCPREERANVLAAFAWAVGHEDAELVDRALPRIRWLDWFGPLSDAAARFALAAAQLPVGSALGAHLQVHEAWMLLWMGRYDEAAERARAAQVVLEAAGHAAGCVAASRTLGHIERRRGGHAQAAAHFREGIERASRNGLDDAQAMLRDALAMALNMLGQHAAARAELARATLANEAAGRGIQLLYNHYNMSQSHSLAAEHALALPWARRALERTRRENFAVFQPYALTELAVVLTGLGRTDEAATHAAEALHQSLALSDRTAAIAAHDALARLALARSDSETAWQHVRLAAAICLDGPPEVTGAQLIPTAALCRGSDPQACAWLLTVERAEWAPYAVRRETRDLLQRTRADGLSPPASCQPADVPQLAMTQALETCLRRLIAAGRLQPE